MKNIITFSLWFITCGLVQAQFISEIDPDQSSTDTQEFVEISGTPSSSLNGLVLILFNGSADDVEVCIDLDGNSIPGDGVFVIGSASVPNVDLVVTNSIQNGAEAVALVSLSDCPAKDVLCSSVGGTVISSLRFASGESNDAGLEACLGGTQYNEAQEGSSTTESIKIDENGNVSYGVPTPGDPTPTIVECSLSNMEISSAVCDGNDVKITGIVTGANTSGNFNFYPVNGSFPVNATFATNSTSGNISFMITFTGPSNGDPIEIGVEDMDNPGCMTSTLVNFPTCPPPADCADLYISMVLDGPLSQGTPKMIKICANDDIADISIFGVGSANNGGGTDGEEFTFPSTSLLAGQCVYIASEIAMFTNFFGFAPDYTAGVSFINGDDAIELFCSGSVVDLFGDINCDPNSSNSPCPEWEYLDGWAYRMNKVQNGGTFDVNNWTFSGPNALDGDDTSADGIPTIPCVPIVSLSDPCNCGDIQNLLDRNGETIRFHDVVSVAITPAPDPVENWVLNVVSGPIYDSRDGNAVASIPFVHIGDGVYQANVWHETGVGFTATATNGLLTNPVSVESLCTTICPRIPTMGQWALLIFGLLMTSLGVVFIYNHRSEIA